MRRSLAKALTKQLVDATKKTTATRGAPVGGAPVSEQTAAETDVKVEAKAEVDAEVKVECPIEAAQAAQWPEKEDLRWMHTVPPCTSYRMMYLGPWDGWRTEYQLPRLPDMLRRLVTEVNEEPEDSSIAIDWNRYKKEVVKKLWCEKGELKALENEAFGVIQYIKAQKAQAAASGRSIDRRDISVETVMSERQNGVYFYRMDVRNLSDKPYRLFELSTEVRDSRGRRVCSFNSLGLHGHYPLIPPRYICSYTSSFDFPGSNDAHYLSGNVTVLQEEDPEGTRLVKKTDDTHAAKLRDAAVSQFSVRFPTTRFGRPPADDSNNISVVSV